MSHPAGTRPEDLERRNREATARNAAWNANPHAVHSLTQPAHRAPVADVDLSRYAVTQPQAPTDRNRSTGDRPVLVQRVTSAWSSGGVYVPPASMGPTPLGSGVRGRTIDINVFDPNYLVTDLQLAFPDTYAAAVATDPRVPTPFVDGITPAWTTSGVDPKYLLRLPWNLRWAAAILDGAAFADLYEACGSGDQTAVARTMLWLDQRDRDHVKAPAGFAAYRDRVERWAYPAADTWIRV